MRAISCDRAQRLLQSYRDGELSLDQQIAVRAHLGGCARCLQEAELLGELAVAIRQASVHRVDGMSDTLASIHARVVARVQAERPHLSAGRRLRDFDDGHLLWAAGGAAAATLVCILALLGVMRMSLREAPYSLAWVLGGMADPGSNRNPLTLDGRVALPSADPEAPMPSPLLKPGEGWLAMSVVVTREGQVRDVMLLPGDASPRQQEIVDLLDAASQARFAPAMAGGEPVAVNVVWLLAHTTVIGREGAAVPLGAPLRRLPPASASPRTTTSGPISATQSPRPALVA
jgi:hypothetical protein